MTPGYLDLKGLAKYSSCSVKWLRGQINSKANPLPCYRVDNGKILVKISDFDEWMEGFRVIGKAEVEKIVNELMEPFIEDHEKRLTAGTSNNE